MPLKPVSVSIKWLAQSPPPHRHTHTHPPFPSPSAHPSRQTTPSPQRRRHHMLLQSTNQFFLFALLWTTQYTAHSTAPSTYKYSTCTCTSCPAHIILTTCPTCLQPIPHQLPSSIQCHRLLRAPPRLCPATATYEKPASPTSAAFP